MSRSTQELSQKLTASETDNNAKLARIQMLEYNLAEIIGTFNEYDVMPCSSLLDRLRQTINRAAIRARKATTT